MLAKIHTSHLGIVKCKQRAKDVLFWPGMARDIEELVSNCDICLRYQPSNPKEPMLSSEVPTRPWEVVSTDLFCLDGEDFLLIVDSYSQYIEIAKLSNTTSKKVIECTKSVFARHGIPAIVKSDNGPQYTAAEYKEFSRNWGFEHITVSPYHPQANGLAEKSVQIIKLLLKKAKADGKDPYLSLLEYRNSTVKDVGSPAQLAMGRRLNSILPCTPQLLAPQTIEPKKVMESIQKAKEENKKYYNRSVRDLPELQPNDSVKIQMNGEWVTGRVIKLAGTPRSYIVEGPNGQQYRRNRKHLKRIPTQFSLTSDLNNDDDDDNIETETHPVEQETVEQLESPTEPIVSSRGRIVKPPSRYQDFVRH